MVNYKSTLNLPRTKFSMRGNLPIKEHLILKKWDIDNLYKIIRLKKLKNKIFLLHDGPPYANGKIHLGHALNKILKDIIVKSKNLSGFNVPYTPTWDCHGLPIEHKVEKIIRLKQQKISNREFRIKCRKYAHKQVLSQKQDFIRLGIFADWENSYLTMDFHSEANIIEKLSYFIENNYIYREFKPVHWCIKCHSSLAEAELEYFPVKCNTIFVKFQSMNCNKVYKKFTNNKQCKKDIYLVIWTTTPWSLIANKAIAVNGNFEYVLLNTELCMLIVAKKLVPQVMYELKISKWKCVGTILGQKLELLKFIHPFLNSVIPVILSDHVNLETGTGIVHIAPDHGPDDFIACKKYNIEPTNTVDDDGNYLFNVHKLLENKNVFESNNIIIELLKEQKNLLEEKKITHSYPHCWRHKQPVFFRATPQWFIKMIHNNLKKNSIDQVNHTIWKPKWGQKRMCTMLLNRPDWCISRQRIWGVPIPILLHKKTGKLHPHTSIIMKKIVRIVKIKGIQAWWDLNLYDLIGAESANYIKNIDILDVWFESGSVDINSIYHNTIFDIKKADLYIEGSDQYRGWFMSSLIISTAIKKTSPYKKILSHGFIVDELGLKMSKSMGNSISPKHIIDKFGADVLRLWVASTDYSKEISISDIILNRICETYRKIRNTSRFILSNLGDFNPERDVISEIEMVLLDKWIIGKTQLLQNIIINLYNDYNFHEIIHHVMQFCSIEMGSFYLDIVKDRLYTMKNSSLARKSCQTALYFIINAFVRWIAPILSFTADEIWSFIPGKRSKYVFTEEWYDKLFYFSPKELITLDNWNKLIQLKNEVNKALEIYRTKKIIKSSLNASLILYVDSSMLKILTLLGDELKFMFITSKVKIANYTEAPKNAYLSSNSLLLKIVVLSIKHNKCQRCWHYVIKKSDVQKNYDICHRCMMNTSNIGETRLFL